MRKLLVKLMIALMAFALIPVQVAQACSAFIVGKELTTDGSMLFGRTEDYPYAPDGGRHNKTYEVVPAKDYKDGDMLEDESNGFAYPHLSHEMKYTATYDAAHGDGSNGNFGAHGFNEAGVSMTSTVSATPHDKILEADPLVKNGLAEAAMVDLVLPRVKTAREGIELVAKVLDEKGSAEGNIIVVADKNELWYMEILSGHQYVAIKFPQDRYAIFANTYYLGHVDFKDKDNVIASKDVEAVAKKADHYKTDKDGNFHIADSYGPDEYTERNRSRTYAGITLMDPKADIKYDDKHFDLLRKPTDPSKKYSQKMFSLNNGTGSNTSNNTHQMTWWNQVKKSIPINTNMLWEMKTSLTPTYTKLRRTCQLHLEVSFGWDSLKAVTRLMCHSMVLSMIPMDHSKFALPNTIQLLGIGLFGILTKWS